MLKKCPNWSILQIISNLRVLIMDNIVKFFLLASLSLPSLCFALPYEVCSDLASCQPLAEQGNAEAQFNLADIYDEGLLGVAKNPEKAALWYTKSANQGNEAAMVSLGDLYYYGSGGVPKDQAKSIEWYQKAADKAQPKARNTLPMVLKKERVLLRIIPRPSFGIPRPQPKAIYLR